MKNNCDISKEYPICRIKSNEEIELCDFYAHTPNVKWCIFLSNGNTCINLAAIRAAIKAEEEKERTDREERLKALGFEEPVKLDCFGLPVENWSEDYKRSIPVPSHEEMIECQRQQSRDYDKVLGEKAARRLEEALEEPPEPTKEEQLAANEKVYQAARDAISEWPQWKKNYAGIE